MEINTSQTIYLMPSLIIAESRDVYIDTILGSCLSVCLYDVALKIGGINHYMLPFWNGDGLASPKYGNIANERLLAKMLSMGATKKTLVAKLFGGASQINSSINIGERNIQIAKEQLQQMGIKVVAENLGGHVGRKIRFNAHTGEVLMRFVSKPENVKA